ncbi:hypothetical protein B0J18DRAFT_220652 [Chaetomium sp. MPI-SDFR-AT-0129]|nr:hypothetical protein B0J18DRAFT_220652 [Chaetomium sp. MPI-SDFR-AT-0129]
MTTSNHRSRGLPFLHRNWLQATNHWESKMSNKLSSQPHDSNDRPPKDDSQTQRTAKRRRIDNGYDGFPLFEGYGAAQRALRIELLKVSHKDSPRLKNGILNGVIAPNVRDVIYVKARCKLTICGFRGGEPVVLHVDSQVCGLRIFKHPPGSAPIARFSSIRPFHIPEEKIFLERDDDAVFGLANTYSVLLELESAGDVNWPPTDLVPVSDEEKFYNRGLPPRHWVLTASISDIFNNRNRKSIRLRVKKHKQLLNDVDVPTNFLIDLDVRWLTALSHRARSRELAKDIQPSISVFDPHELATPFAGGGAPADPPVAGTAGGQQQVGPQTNVTNEGGLALNGHLNGSGLDPADEFAEGELTPSRSRRTRQDINYNVKQMWNNAVGKETRKRRKLGEEHSQVDEHTVTYLLPPEQVQTERFACLLCGAENDRLSQLRAHYLSHPQYDFHFEFRPKAGYCVTVKPNANSFGSPLRPKVYQLGLPVKPLDLEKYVNGDDSWVTSRLGPDNGREVFQDNAPQGGRPKSTIKRTQRKVLVPKTKQPLFDPLSKVQLPAGTVIPQRPLDDSWLLLKHRDNLQDFIDLNAAEKEYLQEWDAFIMRQHLSSQEYLPRHFLRFVREHAAWLVEVRSRADEFSKHAATLLTRRMLPDTVIFEATQLVNDARNRRAAMAGASETASNMSSKERGTAQALLPAPATARNKASGGCCAKCAEPVPMGSLLVCSNKACTKRLYHKHCVENPEAATKARRRWKCAACL